MFDMEKYLVHKGIEYNETESDYQLRECPSCGDRRWKFGISKNKGLSHCFVCGASFNVYSFVSLVDDVDIGRARKIVEGDKDIKILSGAMKSKHDFKVDNKGTKVDKPMGLLPEFTVLDHDILYTKKRGITVDLMKKYDIHLCESGKWKNRLIIPVKKAGKVYGWQGRDIYDKAKQKIMSCKGFRKSRFILNYDRIKNSKQAILSEGPFDCMHSDFFGAFAIFGKEISTYQLNLLLKTKLERVYLGLDPDFPESREKAAKLLSQFFEVWMMPIPSEKDLGDMTQSEIENSIERSELFNDFNKL